tara:strand:+ start:214 stop:519 length:306 start_codon:yes stop_codon:yes gene_type:complete
MIDYHGITHYFIFDISEDIVKTKFPHIQDWYDKHILTNSKDLDAEMLNAEIQMPIPYQLELLNHYYENEGSYEVTTKCQCHRHWAHDDVVKEYEECEYCEL